MTRSDGSPGRYQVSILFYVWLGLGVGGLWLLDKVIFPRIAKMISPGTIAQENADIVERNVSGIQITDEEQRILELLAKGLSNPEIAQQLDVSPVHTSLVTTDLLDRLGAQSKDELVSIAMQKGLLPAS